MAITSKIKGITLTIFLLFRNGFNLRGTNKDLKKKILEVHSEIKNLIEKRL